MNLNQIICISTCICIIIGITIFLLISYLAFEKTIRILRTPKQKKIKDQINLNLDLVIAIYKEPIDWIPDVIQQLKSIGNLRVFLYFKSSPDDDSTNRLAALAELKLLYPTLTLQVAYLPNVGLCDQTYAWHIVNHELNQSIPKSTLTERIVIFTTGSMPFNNIKQFIFYQLILNHLDMLITQTTKSAEKTKESGLGLLMRLNFRGGPFFKQDASYCHTYKGNTCHPITERYQHHTDWHQKIFPELSFPTYGFFGGIFAVNTKVLRKIPKDYFQRILSETAVDVNPDASYYAEQTWYHLFKSYSREQHY